MSCSRLKKKWIGGCCQKGKKNGFTGREKLSGGKPLKTGKFSVSASSREMEFRYFSPFSVFKFKNSKIVVKNWEKYDKKLGVLLSK